jgi:hypothetical protein
MALLVLYFVLEGLRLNTVVGSGTPEGPASEASILPTRRPTEEVFEGPHAAIETTAPLQC